MFNFDNEFTSKLVGFKDAYDKENSADRADHNQPQSFKETPEVIFIV